MQDSGIRIVRNSIWQTGDRYMINCFFNFDGLHVFSLILTLWQGLTEHMYCTMIQTYKRGFVNCLSGCILVD